MDEGKVLLVNLAKGSLGEDTANLLGSLLISRFDLAALSRANVPEEERKPYHLYAFPCQIDQQYFTFIHYLPEFQRIFRFG